MASQERLLSFLRNAGYNPQTIRIIGPETADVAFATGTPPATLSAAYGALATFDWSDAAEQAWQVSQNHQAAQSYLTSSDPFPLAVRAACVTLMLSLQECRAKVNELIAAVKAGSVSNVEALQTGDSIQAGIAQVAALLQSGNV